MCNNELDNNENRLCNNEDDLSDPCVLSLLGISSCVLWGGLVYLFSEIVSLSYGWGLVSSYVAFSIIGLCMYYLSCKCNFCKKKNNNSIEPTNIIEPPAYENELPPKYVENEILTEENTN